MSKEKLPVRWALDVGSQHIRMMAGRPSSNESSSTEIISYSQCLFKGMHQGVIVDPTQLQLSLQRLKSEMEALTGQAIDGPVDVSVSDPSYKCLQVTASVAIETGSVTTDQREALEAEIRELTPVTNEFYIAELQPHHFLLDGEEYTQFPQSHRGHSLQGTYNVFVCRRKNRDMVAQAFEKLEWTVGTFICPHLAIAQAVTNHEQRQKGVAIVDIGATTTKVISYSDGRVQWMDTLPLGGIHFTQDLAVGLRTPQSEAERVKLEMGLQKNHLSGAEESLSVLQLNGTGTQSIDTAPVIDILSARADELFSFVNQSLKEKSLEHGILLTGGGALMKGLLSFAQQKLSGPVDMAQLQSFERLDLLNDHSAFATSLGILRYARDAQSFEPLELSIDTLKKKWTQLKNLIDNIL